jgi:DNA topoisomerase-1
LTTVTGGRKPTSKTTTESGEEVKATSPAKAKTDASTTRRGSSKAAPSNKSKTARSVAVDTTTKGITLVIVESPTKARTISSILGPTFKVMASKGHVADLPEKGLGYDEGTFEPIYEVPSRKAKDLAALKEAARHASRVIIATDPDREGEAIGWHVARLLHAKDPERLEFHEITPRAIREALANPRRIDDDLVSAQEARRVLDRMVGYKASPALWRTVRRGLSAGRVQSVAMALIADREREITAFDIREYWTVHLTLEKEDGIRFAADLRLLDGTDLRISDDAPPALRDEASARQALEHALARRWHVEKVDRTQARRRPQPPFITSTLQQSAGTNLGFSPKRAMSAAQNLYERGLITYMRTDSVAISADAVVAARTVIEKVWGKEYLPAEPRHYTNKAGAQGAHECIRPTDPSLDTAGADLDDDSRRLFRLIRLRFLACQASDAVYDRRSADINAEGCGCVARAHSSRVVFPGWLDVAGVREDDEDGEGGQELPDLRAGELVRAADGRTDQHETKPPARYTEASLVKALEERGVGRPSTYAPTIDVIVERGYALKEGRALKATPLALTVTEWARERIPDLVDPAFTARVEGDLDLIADRQQDSKAMLKRFAESFLPAVAEAVDAGRKRVEGPPPEPTGEMCPECGGELVKRAGQFGTFISCSNYPECKYKPPKVLPEVPQGTEAPSCPNCGGSMVLRQAFRGRGKGNMFWGCANYPSCRGIVSADGSKPEAPKVEPELTALAAATPCPNCGKAMTVRIARKGSNAGKPFLGCTGYPKCKTAVAITETNTAAPASA